MSTDKYATFISGQQKNLSVSGTNSVNLNESKDENDDGWYAHKEMNGDKAISKEDWKKGKRPKLKKEEAELDEAEKRYSDRYIGSVDRSDPDYDAKVKELKSKANKGGTRTRGRLGKDNPNATMYRFGGKHYRPSSQDIKPEHAKSVDIYSKKGKANEETENLDEWGNAKPAIKGTHAHKAPAVTPGKIRFKGRPTKPKAQTDLGLRKEELELTTEEVQYMEEMLGKGKINDVADHHMRNYKHHERMMDHHNKMVDHSERVGDKEGVEHHLHKAMGHSYDMEQHEAKLNHALKLKTQLKAHKAMQQAKSDLNRAHLAVARARDEKRDGV